MAISEANEHGGPAALLAWDCCPIWGNGWADQPETYRKPDSFRGLKKLFIYLKFTGGYEHAQQRPSHYLHMPGWRIHAHAEELKKRPEESKAMVDVKTALNMTAHSPHESTSREGSLTGSKCHTTTCDHLVNTVLCRHRGTPSRKPGLKKKQTNKSKQNYLCKRQTLEIKSSHITKQMSQYRHQQSLGKKNLELHSYSI